MGTKTKTNAELPAYQQDVAAVFTQFDSNSNGLSASEVSRRQQQYGSNSLQALKGTPTWKKYLRQYKDLMIVLLVASAVVSAYLGDQRTAFVLMAIVLFNTTLGFLQEFKAEKIMQALEKLVKPEAEVYRDGKLEQIDSTLLVPGDIVRIAEGDSVPADVRIFEESELATNDFALTGESNPTRKFTHAIERAVAVNSQHNLAFMGTTVATGEARGIVIATGMQTELGRIASLSSEAPESLSPLQRELNSIATRISIGVVFLCAVLIPISIKADLGLKDGFLFAIGFASSLIPQGLPAEINTALAQAASKLAKAKALVKKLSAVETLGATHIICTDKTGTLTKNQMTVEQVIIGHEVYAVSGTGYEAMGGFKASTGQKVSTQLLKKHEQFFMCGALASNAKVVAPDNEHAEWYCLGDPTEGALITLARKAGIEIEEFEQKNPELKEFTFDSARKRMSSLRNMNGTLTAFVKGAPEGVLERCTHIYDGHTTRKITPTDKKWLIAQHEERASQAYRNLAYAVKELPAHTDVHKLKMEQAESGLTLLGMVSMLDPLREEVPEAMYAAHEAHIRVNVITGDFALTAEAIAKKAGLAGKNEHLIVIAGDELKKNERY